MNLWHVKKTALLVGIALFSLAFLGQSALAGVNGPRWTPKKKLRIKMVHADFDNSELIISGVNFDNKNPPRVTLGDSPLTVLDYSATQIRAELSQGLVGDFLLTVKTGRWIRRYDKYNLTIGAVGPEGQPGQDGQPGKDGKDGADGNDGAAGLSAYEVAVAQGFRGDETQWLASLKGDKGDPGQDGADGQNGADGKDGKDGAQGPQGPKGDKGDQGLPGPGGPVLATTEECVESESGVSCEQNTIVTVPVSYGIETVMQMVADLSDPDPIRIEITKTQPQLIYPLTHFHTVAYFPHEEIVKVPNAVAGVGSCNDSPDAEDPTCGWTTIGGERIEDSQGFCCNKDLEQDVGHPDPVQGAVYDRFRGERFLDERSSALNSFSTAHCLRQGDLFYDGYEIGGFRKTYDILVKLTQGSESHTFVLSPENPIYEDSSNPISDIKVQLLDEVDEYRRAPDLSNYILYIPSIPYPHEYVQNWHINMLMVPREEVSKDGSELDKVGVSFSAFRRMGGGCRVTEAGDGLHNQLFHKHNEDLVKLASDPNAEPTYLVHGKRMFKGMNFMPGMEKYIVYWVPDINYSRLSLSVGEDARPRMIETESDAIIMEAFTNSFTSMSDEGTLEVGIQNVGELRSDYIVTVTEPNLGIIPAIPAQARTLDPGGNATLFFDVHTADNQEITNSFLVTLWSPTGRKYDATIAIFDSFKHDSRYSWDLLQKNEGSQTLLP